MSDRVVFHIGAEKTGSTSIQEGLALLESRLAAYGVKMASAGRHRPTMARNVLPWRDADAVEWADLRKELRRPEQGVDTLVVSNQALWRQRDGILRRLQRYLDGRPAHVVMYVREQADFLQSLAMQNCKNSRRTFDFDDPEVFADFAAKRAPDYDEVCERFATIMGADVVEARPYDEAQFIRGELIADFLSVLIPSIEFANPPNPHANPSLAPELARILHTDEVRGLDADEDEILDTALRISAEPRREKFFLNEATVREIRRSYADSNNRLASRYLRRGAILPQHVAWPEGIAPLARSSRTDLVERIANETAWAPRLVRGWRGRSGPIEGIFGAGWEFVDIDSKACARMVEGNATLRFRTDFQRECSVNGALELELGLETTDPAPMHVTVNKGPVVTLDLTLQAIPLPDYEQARGHWEITFTAPPGPRSIEVHGLHVGYGRPVFAKV
ncbi:MAG: hypothetical protein HKN26_05365 [Acidimicrobiales bacterium]|nr:hypothetical protein [Acidimicrobiales bacterium]